MIGVPGIVGIILTLLVAAAILGLLWWLIRYLEAQGFGPPVMFKAIRIVFVVLVVLLLIGYLLNLTGVNVT